MARKYLKKKRQKMGRMVTPHLQPDKYKAALLYILNKCGQLPNVGKTVIWKILYFSDFDNYELRENSITGETYRKLLHGPAPSSFNLIIEQLKKERAISAIRQKYFDKTQYKFMPLEAPDMSHITSEERNVIDNAIGRLSHMNAQQISEYSHSDIPWMATPSGGIIKYELVFYRHNMTAVSKSK